ncbi:MULTISPECIES: hypothetical protein [Geomonas]|nr:MULTISPECIES: hypothetical protein [Geomonas]
MKAINYLFGRLFHDMDRPLEKLREIRDSYRELNVEIYGEQLARILNEW